MIILRQRTYAEEEKEGMGLGKRLAIAGSIAGAGALAYAGARRGMLGGRAQMATNMFHGQVGEMFGNKRMMVNATNGYTEGMARRQASLRGASFNSLSTDEQKNMVSTARNMLGYSGKERFQNMMVHGNTGGMSNPAKAAGNLQTTPKQPSVTPVNNTATPSAQQQANTNTTANQTSQQQTNSQNISNGTAKVESPAVTKVNEANNQQQNNNTTPPPVNNNQNQQQNKQGAGY